MTTCTHGHEMTEDNIVTRNGKPRCRTCERIHGARYRAKKSAPAEPAPVPFDPAGESV